MFLGTTIVLTFPSTSISTQTGLDEDNLGLLRIL